VTDRSLKVIADLCPALQDLDLAKCGITDNGIVSLLSARQQAIQILSLSGCMQITDKCLPFIEKMGETLLGLNLQHCSGLSQMALDSVGAHLWQCDLLVS
jgi:EIN3-binding F-box protein